MSPGDLPATHRGERLLKVKDGWVFIPPQRACMQLLVKRFMDASIAASLLIALSPVLLIIAILVKLTSAGPVLYSWRVVGENGRTVSAFKFRTMVRDADALKAKLAHLNERHGPVFKMAQDPRVTPLGRWLRKYSVDELPQLWNVLVGDMSLVGPRPPSASEYRQFDLWQMRKVTVKPGLTCLWQVDGRRTITDFADWAQLDLRYIDNWSLWQDVSILWRTPNAVLKGTGS
jgi:lipopolysaccharide/colanic/teichoic acid biosynthesis glycosyltransferase